MNRIHRVVWSQARNCFVAASETAHAKDKPSSTRKAIAASLAALFLAPGLAAAQLCNSTTPVTSALAVGQCWGDVDVTVTNTGSITVNDPAGSATAALVNANPYTHSFTNNNTINASGSGAGGLAVYGLEFSRDVGATGRITNANTGTISANATGSGGSSSSSAWAYGVRVGGNLAGSLNNSGTIRAQATNDNGSATAMGVRIQGTISGPLSNTGSISVEASGQWATADGINVGNVTATGSVTNDSGGNIHAKATAGSGGSANGIYIGDGISSGGSVTNNGHIQAEVIGTGGGRVAGIYIPWTGNHHTEGTVTNAGTISASISGSASNQAAYGIRADSLLNGSINNSGTITVTNVNGPAWSIYAGTGTGSVNNQATGALYGALYAYNGIRVQNDGLLDTRQNGSYADNYTQGVTGTFALTAASSATRATADSSATQIPGTYGSLSVVDATLASGTSMRVNGTAGNTLAAGDVLHAITASNSLSLLGPVNVSDNIMALNFVASRSGNTLDLTAAATGFNSVADALRAAGQGASGAAGVLDGLLPNVGAQPGALRDMLYAIGSAGSPQRVADLVSQTLPLLAGGTNLALQNTLQDTSRLVQARLDGKQGLSSGDAFLGNKYFWLKPFGSWANQNDRNGASGFDARTSGVAFGADGELNKANRLGVALAYAQTNVDGNSAVAPNSARVNTYQAILYGSHSLEGGYEFSYQADIGRHDSSGQRNILTLGSVAHSNYDAWSTHLGAGLGRTIKASESTSYTPSIRADYTRIKSDGYTEAGAGALNLTVGSDSVEQFILSADAKLNHKLSESTTFSANLGAGYDLINHRNSATAAFAGAPSAVFITQGIDPSPWSLRGGLGLAKMTSTGTEISARYDLDVKEGFTNQTASVKVRVPF